VAVSLSLGANYFFAARKKASRARGFCAPMSDRSPVAVRKVGPCPSNWAQAGAYCLEMRRR
jgi:hypothetical protein